MGIQIIGQEGNVAGVDGTTFRALKINQKPTDYGSLGYYQMAVKTGAMAAGGAADGEVFQFRWTHATNLAIVQEVTISGWYNITTGFTAGEWRASLWQARSWTADGTGGNAITATGNNKKMRSSMGTSLINGTGQRISSTALLGAGTKTFDNDPVEAAIGWVPTTVNSVLLGRTQLWSREVDNSHPIILSQDTGIALRLTVPATGLYVIGVGMRWAEVPSY